MLFEETFFNGNNQSFPVLCIDQPLEGGIGKNSILIDKNYAENLFSPQESLKRVLSFILCMLKSSCTC